MNAPLSRRALLLLTAGSVAAACSPGREVPAVMEPLPLPAATTARRVPATAVKPVAHWAAIFGDGWDYQYANSLPQSRSADSWDHYNLSYSVDACIAMFRATGERRYLDRALELVENVAASAVPSNTLRASRFSDDYRGWASSRSGEGGDEVPLYESYFWRYGTALLVAMRDDPAVYGDAKYRARHGRLLDFAETHVFAKWYGRGPQKFIYRDRTHMASHWALIALHLSVLTADADRGSRYRTVLGEIDKRLRGQLRRNPAEPTAYFWSDIWGSARRPGQDVGHGNGVLAYVLEAHDRGSVWTDADVAAFAAVLKVIWPGGRTYRAHVDGTGTDNGWLADGFVKLGRTDPAVQLRLEGHQVVNDQFAANMALNAKILRGPA